MHDVLIHIGAIAVLGFLLFLIMGPLDDLVAHLEGRYDDD